MKGTILTIVGTLVCVAALAGWSYTVPQPGSGYILFVAFLGSFVLIDSIRKGGLASIAGFVISAAAFTVWWLHRDVEHVIWVLLLGALTGLAAFSALSSEVSTDTQEKKEK